MRTTISMAICALGLACASVPAFAHHSFAAFDQTKCARLSGTVRVFQFTYPHTWVWVYSGAANGTQVLWGFQAADPASMSSRGFNSQTIKTGDKVTVIYNPLKDGRKGGSMLELVRSDGSVLKNVGDYEIKKCLTAD